MTVEIPDWVWAKKHFAGGHRLAKFVKFEKWRSSPTVTRHPVWKPAGGSPTDIVPIGNLTAQDSLTVGDLRYWRGVQSEIGKAWGTCRACGWANQSHAERKKHLQNGLCQVLMANTMRMMRSDALCAACGKPTTNDKWGIPLCSKTCEHEFAYEFSKPPQYRLAFEKVRNELSKQFNGRVMPSAY